MLELKISVPELREYVKDLGKIKENIFALMRLDMTEVATDFLNNLLQMELELFLGRSKHERQSLVNITNRNYRNGYYKRSFVAKGLGKLQVKIPRDRAGKYSPKVFEKYQRMETSLKEDMAITYLMGASTRNLSLISKRLLGTKVSHSQISQCSSSLVEAVEKWRNREITKEFKYLYIDGTNFKMRIGDSVELVTVLVVIGVDSSGIKNVLAIQAGDKESAGNWRELFRDLKARGLQTFKVKLGIMDGLRGLEKVFKEEFPKSKIQRCQVHVRRNVIRAYPKTPASLNAIIANEKCSRAS